MAPAVAPLVLKMIVIGERPAMGKRRKFKKSLRWAPALALPAGRVYDASSASR